MALWKGRFRTPLDASALKFSTSLGVDRRLYHEDIAGSIAHVRMLARRRIISSAEAKRIERALRKIESDIRKGRIALEPRPGREGRFVDEDVHMAIEHLLIRRLGKAGGKLHTARSRNDQIALDERLYLKQTIEAISDLTRNLQRALLAKADEYRTVIMPGYTHLQQAQPVLLAHHLLAYVSMLERDRGRFADCLRRADQSPLGAGALAGTSFPIDRRRTARDLGLDGIVENSIDAVSDRDVQAEFLSSCAITMMHLSRLAEEFVLWSTREWDFAEIGDAFTTGSSIMPQKKNPDMAELVRGKTGRVYGDLITLLVVMKGLPLAYNRDMQEDKEAIFDAADTVADCLAIFSAMVGTVRFNVKRFEHDRGADAMLATELADYLVRKGLPFRKAHAVVGAIVRLCAAKHLTLKELPLRDYRRHSPVFGRDLWQVLDLRKSLVSKRSEGSTSPREVVAAIRRWKRTLAR